MDEKQKLTIGAIIGFVLLIMMFRSCSCGCSRKSAMTSTGSGSTSLAILKKNKKIDLSGSSKVNFDFNSSRRGVLKIQKNWADIAKESYSFKKGLSAMKKYNINTAVSNFESAISSGASPELKFWSYQYLSRLYVHQGKMVESVNAAIEFYKTAKELSNDRRARALMDMEIAALKKDLERARSQ